MTDLNQVSMDDIETGIMSILYANMGACFNQFSLYDKLIKDKFPANYNTTINPVIKAKFLFVLRNLASRYDDILIAKENNVYTATCLADKNDKVTQTINPVQQTSNVQTSNVQTSNVQTSNVQTSISGPEYIDLINYLIDNNIDDKFEDLNYIDPFDGNTIYHDLVITNNLDKIKKLIDTDRFNYTVENKKNLTPIMLSTNQEITSTIINGLTNKYIKDTQMLKTKLIESENKINHLESKVILYESESYKKDMIIQTGINKIVLDKIQYNFNQYKNVLVSLFILFMLFLFIF